MCVCECVSVCSLFLFVVVVVVGYLRGWFSCGGFWVVIPVTCCCLFVVKNIHIVFAASSPIYTESM